MTGRARGVGLPRGRTERQELGPEAYLTRLRRRSLLFRVTDEVLYVANFGRRFDRRGVVSVCRENLSAKTGRGPGTTLDDVSDQNLVDAIRERRLSVYGIDRDQLQEDANHEEETSSDYAGRSLWELLQNADDALAPTGTSSADLIGAKGLGFKSVLEISDRPSIHSGPFDFGFDAELSRRMLENIQRDAPRLTFRLPHRVERDKQANLLLREGYATVVRLPFRSRQARVATVARLASLDPHFLLLCRNLDTVVVERPDLPTLQMSVSRQRSATLRNSPATLSITRGDEVISTEWRIWSALAPAPAEREKSLSAAIAIPLEGGIPVPGAAEIPIHVFFPTTETIGARFLVHGSFALTSNRNNIRPDQHDQVVRDELAQLVTKVVDDIPAASTVRLFADIVRAAGGGKAKRPDRLIQQAIARAVTGAEFVDLIGGGAARPGEVRTWEHDLHKVVPSLLAKEAKLPPAELAPVFGELRSAFGAQPFRPAEYADILSRTRATSMEPALQALRICYAGCLAATQQDTIVQALARAEIWPTEAGTFRSLTQQPSLLRTNPVEWPSWLPADMLHPQAQELLDGYDAAAAARWSSLLSGRLLRSPDEWLRCALAPTLESWRDEDWERHGFEALELIEKWAPVPDFGAAVAFVERPDDTTVRPVLARVARVPTRSGWVATRDAYANRELGAPPELAAYFKGVADRHVVGVPRQALALFGHKRWKAVLRFLGVCWEPKVQLVSRDGSLASHPSYYPFRRDLSDSGILHITQEWYIEHFPNALEHLGPSHVAGCVSALVAATANLMGRWRKVYGADRTHSPAPFNSFAHYQLRRARYLPQRQVAGRRGERLAPHELFWPGKGIAGVTPILDLGTTNQLRRAALKTTFIDRLGVRNSLPRDWATWCTWSDELLARVEAGSAPSPKSVRDFYDALLHTPIQRDGTRKITKVAAIRPGQQDEVVVEKSSETLWIDQGRFENQEVLNGLGQLGRAVLPVRLERGNGAVQILGVRRASETLTIDPSFEPASDRKTRLLENRVACRRGALAAICSTKNLPLKSLPKLAAVQDLRLRISIDGELLTDRISASYNDGARWLISLQAPDIWEAVAAALAEPFGGHAPDLKYRFARVLRARRAEIAAILADDGIPGYRIRDALHDFDETGEEEEAESETGTSGGPDASGNGSSGDDGDPLEEDGYQHEHDPFETEEEDDEEEQETGDSGSKTDHRSKAGNGGDGSSGGGRKRRLNRRNLFGGGREQDEDRRDRTRRSATEAASAAAGRGMRAEAWLMQQIVSHLDPSWTCLANVRDDQLRETDVLLSRDGKEWHVEVKCLSAERLYWSELEREKAERYPGRYFMALLVETGNGGFGVHWSWDPLRDLAPLGRRIEWLWESSSEGPSLREGWRLESTIRWPERRADRYIHVVRVTQEDLERLDQDEPELRLLREKIGDGPSAQPSRGDGAQVAA